ncbi:hypothetical protein [Streptomyces anulatus]|uniref:hypothetical protein n=1 Tax=Streptomyces anulatus TaxID=1892 RepID=UPI001C25862B|nr:hypothetical protein [Streptomyces anulatus]
MTTTPAPVKAPSSPRKINGLEIVEVEFAETPLSTPSKSIRFKQIVKILLEDGSVTYGCAWAGCGFTGDTSFAIRPHLRVHAPETPDISKLSVGELLELAESAHTLRTDLNQTTRERDRLAKSLNEDWKPRALAAERQLSSIQRALAPVT